MQGIVKTFDSNRGIGIIHGKNGDNYPLILADVFTPQSLKTGQLVRFSLRYVNDHAFATNVCESRSSVRRTLDDYQPSRPRIRLLAFARLSRPESGHESVGGGRALDPRIGMPKSQQAKAAL